MLTEQSIGGFAVAPALGLLWRRGVRLSSHLSSKLHHALIPPSIAQITSTKLLLCPIRNVQRHCRHDQTSVLASCDACVRVRRLSPARGPWRLVGANVHLSCRTAPIHVSAYRPSTYRVRAYEKSFVRNG